jgi:hypothetical protein
MKLVLQVNFNKPQGKLTFHNFTDFIVSIDLLIYLFETRLNSSLG